MLTPQDRKSVEAASSALAGGAGWSVEWRKHWGSAGSLAEVRSVTLLGRARLPSPWAAVDQASVRDFMVIPWVPHRAAGQGQT